MLTKLKDITRAEDAIRAAGLDWHVEQAQLIASNGKTVESHKALYRSDTNTQLGVVGQGYVPIQNTEVFAFFDTIVNSYGATYKTAGSVKDGKRIFIQAKLNQSFDAQKGDRVDSYLTLASSHDGSSSLKAFLTPIRLVCQNQLIKAIKNSSTNITLRHTSSVQYRIRDALHVFKLSGTAFSEFKIRAQYLAQKQVDRVMVEKFLEELIPDTGSTRSINQRDTVKRLFEQGKGNRGRNAWELYNSATEWVDHERTSDPDKAMDSAMFGSGSNLKGKAFATAMAL